MEALRKLRDVVAETSEEFGLELEGFSVSPTADDGDYAQVIFIFRNIPRAFEEEDPEQRQFDEVFKQMAESTRAHDLQAQAVTAREKVVESLGEIDRRTGLGFDE